MSEQQPVVFAQLSRIHAEKYNYLRLNALLDYPEAFGSSYDDEVQRSLEEVENRLVNDQRPDDFVLGAFMGDVLCGFVGLVRHSHRKLQHKAYIWGMYVVSEYQRHGIGRGMLLEVLARARTIDDLEILQLSVSDSNTAAIKLYQSTGFKIYATEPKAFKIGDRYIDEHLMWLELTR